MSMKTASVPNTLPSALLMMPIFGLARKIHDTVKRIAGITRGTRESAKNSDLNGVSVRSLTQAKNVPLTKATAADPMPKATELPNRRSVSVLR